MIIRLGNKLGQKFLDSPLHAWVRSVHKLFIKRCVNVTVMLKTVVVTVWKRPPPVVA